MSNSSRRISESVRARFSVAATSVENTDDAVSLETARSGALTGRIGAIYLHSRYDPAREAAKFVEGQGALHGKCVALYGAGLGYHIQPLLEAIGPEGRLVVAEANNSILKAALSVLDEHILLDPRLTLAAGADETEFLEQWRKAFSLLDPDKTNVVIHPPSASAIPESYGKLKNMLEMIKMDRRFPAVMGSLEKDNLSRNLERILVSPGISSLANTLHGAAVVVGAGPSLDRDLPLLTMCIGVAAILSSDTALPILAAAGITPDMVFTVDPQPHSVIHFRMSGFTNLPLAAAVTASPAVINQWDGDVFFGFINPDKYPSPAREFALGRGTFSAGGSVSIFAAETAFAMGASSVIMFGQDFAYTGGKAYATGSAPYFWGVPADIDDTVEEKNYFGRTIKTSPKLYSYMRELENLAFTSASPIFTMAPDGIFIRGVTPVSSPLEVITAPRDFSIRIPAGTRRDKDTEAETAFMRWAEERR